MYALIAAAFAQATGGDVPQTSGQLFRPTIDGTHTLWADDSARADDGAFIARGVLHYARNPVLYVDGNDQARRIVGDLFQLSVLGGFTKGPVRIGVDVPVYLRSFGEFGGAPGTSSESGLGDVALDVKASLVDRERTPVGFALAGRASLPTATVENALGNRGFGWELGAIVDGQADALLITGNVGVKGVPRAELENFDWGNQLVARVGGGYAITDMTGVSLDFGSHINLTDPDIDASPVEGILGGWVRASDAVIRGGVGTGLTTGFGAPELRVILGVGYEPPKVRDADLDGIVDKDDACPTVAEDPDGFADEDGCPEPTSLLVRVVDQDGQPIPTARFTVVEPGRSEVAGNEVPVPGGTYTIEVSAEGYDPLAPQSLVVPDAERHAVEYRLERTITPGTLTVEIRDGDGKPIDGATWVVQGEAEPHAAGTSHSLLPGDWTVRASAPGWRPAAKQLTLDDGEVETAVLTLAPAKVELTRERIDIKESVYFETGKDVIKPESFGLLDEVAQIITEHPELTRIRIEGHTDSRGSNASNLDLSKRRAASVLNYLVGKGVDAGRLQSEGYGEDKPIAQGANEAAWSKNRRVDFFVVERAE